MQTVEIKTKWNLEDELAHEFSEILQQEIDKEFVQEMQMVLLLKEGWICPEFKYLHDKADMGAWVHINAQGEYKNLNGKWIFKNGADATAFTLRWA